VLAHPAPPAGRDLQQALYHFARGAALAGKRQGAEAAKELKALEAAATRVATDTMYSTVNSASTLLNVARLDLAARIEDARGGGAAAAEAWRRAIAAEDRVGYGEPPDWLFPTRESLGNTFMRMGSFAEAERAYREDLAKYRKNPRSLFGVWKSLERQGKPEEALKAKAEFDAAWAGADTTLSDAAFASPRKTTN
jgi:tetratricopeptide (TPR) repeat protein